MLRVALVLGLILLLPGRARAALPNTLAEAPRFAGRLQVLSGAGFALPVDATRNRSLGVYVPLEVEVAVRVRGLFSLGLGAIGYAAPFRSPACPDASSPGARTDAGTSALGAYGGARLDFNNSRDGSWLSPWIEMRVGLVGQDGVASPLGSATDCTERVALSPWLGPRAGLDLWLGQAGVTFAAGYDYLPRASAITALVGLALRLF